MTPCPHCRGTGHAPVEAVEAVPVEAFVPTSPHVMCTANSTCSEPAKWATTAYRDDREAWDGEAYCDEHARERQAPRAAPVEPASVEAYYFGPWKGFPAHRWRDPSGRAADFHAKAFLPAALHNLDATYCPGRGVGVRYPGTRPEVEGEASIHHVEDWTVLAWWDRSVDERPGANSNIVARGTWDFEAMVSIAKAQFVEVWARQRAGVRVVGA